MRSHARSTLVHEHMSLAGPFATLFLHGLDILVLLSVVLIEDLDLMSISNTCAAFEPATHEKTLLP